MSEFKSSTWPLLFSHHGTIMGNGFLAEIEIHGRLLATKEPKGVWIDGVNPGAIAVGAQTLSGTYGELRNVLALVFIDFANQARNFDEFKAKVELFFNETDPGTVHDWENAVIAVRSGAEAGPDGLPRMDASTARYVSVKLKTADAVTTKDNSIIQQESQDSYYTAAAA